MMDNKRILLIKMSSLGDIIQAWPVVVAIKKAYPNAHITWAVQEQFKDLVPGKPYVDDVFIVDRKKLFSLSYIKELRKKLQARHYDIVIDLQCILKSMVVALCTGVTPCYGYCDAKEGTWLFHKIIKGKHKDGNVVERYLDTIRGIGISDANVEYPEIDFSKEWYAMQPLLEQRGIDGPFAVFAIATRWKNKNWPPRYFAKMAKFLIEEYNMPVILTGAPSDKAIAQAIAKEVNSDMVVDFTGKTSILEMFSLIQHCHFFLGGDSGPTHFANANQKPMIALFGATYPSRSGPYGNPNAAVLLSKTAPKDTGKLDNKIATVMDGLTPEMVMDTYRKMHEEGIV